MPICECDYCGGKYQWEWEDAFDKFGFNDGDGQVETYTVEEALTKAGYEVEVDRWGLHNLVITSIKKDGKVVISSDSETYSLGYDNPRDFLPKEIIEFLDTEL